MESGRRYRVIEPLGRGGFGTVFRAELLTGGGFRRSVALKLLHEERAEASDRARFRDEAQLLALIRHRSIVGVDALVEVDGRWVMVMELVEGADLDALLRRGAPPVRVTLQIVEEIANALVAAYETVADGRPLRLVHRDLKHGNVRITPRGEVKLLDFGIASGTFDGRLADTATGEVMGTARFMAPERMAGTCGPATDVYSLGVMACDLLTGSPLPPTSTLRPEEQAALVAARLRDVDAEVAPAVVELVTAMLAYDPAGRPDAREVASRCRALARDATGPWLDGWAPGAVARSPARPAPAEESTLRWVGRTLGETGPQAPATPSTGSGWRAVLGVTAVGLAGGMLVVVGALVVLGLGFLAAVAWIASPP